MTARVYRADDPRRTGEHPAREGVVLHSEPLRGDAVLCALIEAHLRAAPDCDTTHHTGCACHEARRDARERELAEAIRSLATTHRVGRWCVDCGATLGTQHVATCPVGRALRVLDGGAT